MTDKPIRKALKVAAGLGQGRDDTVGHLATGEIVIPIDLQKKHPELVSSLRKAFSEAGIDYDRFVVGSGKNKTNTKTKAPMFDEGDGGEGEGGSEGSGSEGSSSEGNSEGGWGGNDDGDGGGGYGSNDSGSSDVGGNNSGGGQSGEGQGSEGQGSEGQGGSNDGDGSGGFGSNDSGSSDVGGLNSGWSGFGGLGGYSESGWSGEATESSNANASGNAGAFGIGGPNDASGYAGSYGGPQGSYGTLGDLSAASFGNLSTGLNAAGPEAATTANENETQGNPYGDLSGVLGFGVNQSVGPAGAFGLSGRGDPSGYNTSNAGSYGALGGNPNAGTTANTEGAFGLGGPESAGNYGGAYSGSQSAGTSAGTSSGTSAGTSSSGQTSAGGPTAASSTSYNLGPSFMSDPMGWLANKAENVAQNAPSYAVNAMMMGVPVVGTVNTLSGLLGGPTIGGMMQSGTPAGPADMSADLGGGGSSTVSRQPSLGGSGGGGGGGSPSTVVATPALPALRTLVPTTPRVYLGLPADQYGYGFGGERAFYAEGGPVTAPNPPTQVMLSPMPTMAYTDGQGYVGAVAAPPAMSGYDMVGSDAPHASPTAPAPAAAAPSFMPPPQRAATYNTNASPVAAPISQNPNLGYSLGMPPLTGLKG
jgi:hypothetical protein